MRREASEHLSGLRHEARDVVEEARGLVRGLEEAQLLWRPAENRWGIADCFEHLVATGRAYYPRVRDALTGARPSPGPHEYRPRLLGRLFIHFAGPDGRVKLPALGPFRPPTAAADAPFRFIQQQRELLEMIDGAAGLDLQCARVQSPISRFLALTLGECLTMLVQHQRRHLAQARDVKEADGFPDD